MKAPDPQERPHTGLRWPGIVAVLTSLCLLGGGAAWAHYTNIQGAVIAVGTIAVNGKPRAVQHLDGGVVENILVADGDAVEKGALLMRLDPTVLEANLQIYRTRYVNADALAARLRAEMVDEADLSFEQLPQFLAGMSGEKARAGQIAIFNARTDMRAGRREQLREKIKQFGNQIEGTQEVIAAKEEQLGYIDQELQSVTSLKRQRLVRDSQVLAIQRSRADLLGQLGEHRSELARIANSVRDTELELIQQERQRRQDAVTELRDVTASLEELTQQIISTQRQLERIDIRAPVSGLVHEMQIVTVGGVVPPGGTVAQIIPTGDGYTFDTRIDPASVDQVHLGQPARVTLVAFNQRTTPELRGAVSAVSPDTVVDQATGETFYRVRIDVPDEELAKIGELELLPGMPVSAFLQTQERTVLSYLARPLSDQLDRAFREE